MDEFAKKLSNMNHERGWNFQLATCGEKIDPKIKIKELYDLIV